jgi:hypothetical protein
MKGPRRARMRVHWAGSKCLGRGEKEAEWLRFLRVEAPGNSHCAPTEEGNLRMWERGRVFQGMCFALLACYTYCLLVVGIAFPRFLSLGPAVLIGALIPLAAPPVFLGLLLLGGIAGAVIGHCATFRPESQAWIEGAFIGGLFGAAAAVAAALYVHSPLGARLWGGRITGNDFLLFVGVVPYAAVWGAAAEAFWARGNNAAGPVRT